MSQRMSNNSPASFMTDSRTTSYKTMENEEKDMETDVEEEIETRQQRSVMVPPGHTQQNAMGDDYIMTPPSLEDLSTEGRYWT